MSKFILGSEDEWYKQRNRTNPLSPTIYIQILQTDLYTFPERMRQENLIKDQGIFT